VFFDRIVVTTGCDFLQKAFWRRWGGGNLVEAGWKPALPGKVRFIQCLTLSALLLNLSANIACAHGGGGGGFGHGGGGMAGGFGGGFGHGGFAGGGGFGRGLGMYGGHVLAPQPYWNHWNQSMGNWGAWARPVHWNTWYSSWAGWGYLGGGIGPITAAPMVFNSANMVLPQYLREPLPEKVSVAEVYAQLVNADGRLPPPREYNYQPDNYLNVISEEAPPHTVAQRASSVAQHSASASVTQQAAAEAQQAAADAQQSVSVASEFRLGPDADILPSGKIAIFLTNRAYLMLTPKMTQVIDQETGLPILSLATDPFMLWHVQVEIKRQMQLLQKLVDAQASQTTSEAANTDEQIQQKVQKIKDTIDLLGQASKNLGEAQKEDPRESASETPVPGAIEILASVWLSPSGKYAILKLPDGKLAYMDGSNLYSDEGETKLSIPYPEPFKNAVESYLSGLIAESDKMIRDLFSDWQYTQALKNSLKGKLKQQRNEANVDPAKSTTSVADAQAASDRVKRLEADITRTQKRLESINLQFDEIPKEVSASRKLLRIWG